MINSVFDPELPGVGDGPGPGGVGGTQGTKGSGPTGKFSDPTYAAE